MVPPVGLEPTTCGLTGPNLYGFVLFFSVFLLFICYFNSNSFISCIFITSFIMRFLINGQITASEQLIMRPAGRNLHQQRESKNFPSTKHNNIINGSLFCRIASLFVHRVKLVFIDTCFVLWYNTNIVAYPIYQLLLYNGGSEWSIKQDNSVGHYLVARLLLCMVCKLFHSAISDWNFPGSRLLSYPTYIKPSQACCRKCPLQRALQCVQFPAIERAKTNGINPFAYL